MLSIQARAWRVLARFRQKNAAPLTDVSKLRYQAVFLMGAGGSGKGYVSHRWLKYMPGGGAGGASRQEWGARALQEMSEQMRGLSNMNFEKAKAALEKKGIRIELVDGGRASLPFRLYTYDNRGQEHLVDPSKWEEDLPPQIYEEVQGLKEVVFGTPVHELPSYWRQVNPDIYKEELAGYMESQPGYVHEMSSEMSKAYFEAALETGDPLFVDGTGSNLRKMNAQIKAAKDAGYKVSLVFVFVPLTVNQIRNATRARKVNPMEVTRQWKLISKNYAALRNVADKATVVINRNDPSDRKKYIQNADFINDFIRRGTRGQYNDLYELIAAQSPNELRDWGALLKGK